MAIHNKESTAKEFQRLIYVQILPALGKLKVASITRQDILELHQRMRDTMRQANQTLSVLSKIFSLAEVWGLRPEGTNPCRLIKKFPERRRNRILSDEELKRLGKTLQNLTADGSTLASIIAAIRILALTGCRLGEVLNLRWSDIDLKNSKIRLTDSKTGPRDLPIGKYIIEVFRTLPDANDSAWVLNGRKMDAPLSTSSVETAWRRIRTQAEIPDVRLHDLRHTVGTIAAATGANAFLVRDKLGHRTIAMSSLYVGRVTQELGILSEKIEGHIARTLDQKL